MRSISFGPTSYLEDSRQQSRHSDDEDDGQNTHISNESVGNSYSSSYRGLNEVIFYSSENLFREGFTSAGGAGSHHRELAMKKHCKCKFAYDSQRTFQSYCFEFCGLLNIRMNDVKFYLGNREPPMNRSVRKPCIIEVQSNHGSVQSGRSGQSASHQNTCLQIAIRELMDRGLYSDIDIVINSDETNMIKSHKAILMARSEKFRAMIECQMRESRLSRVEVTDPDITVPVYKLLMQWIYEGECDLTGSTIDEMLGLLKLTDEYLLPDLQKTCEDTIIDSMDGVSALQVLTDTKFLIPTASEQSIKDAAKSTLLDEYEAVERQVPDIEERISKVKGLMSDLFTHKLKKKKGGASGASGSRRGKKGTIVIDEGGSKKRVRFNISSTIYEEASAIIHDESDSMIEPLSIYSNSSPPGELINDEIIGGAPSSTRSLTMPTVSERRNSEGIMISGQLNNSINAVSGGDTEELLHESSRGNRLTNEDEDPELSTRGEEASPRVRFNLRPASATGNARHPSSQSSFGPLRRASSYHMDHPGHRHQSSAGGNEQQPESRGTGGTQSSRGGSGSQSLLI